MTEQEEVKIDFDLQKAIDEYLAKGGKITVVPFGKMVSSTDLPKDKMSKTQLKRALAREQEERAKLARFEMQGVL